MRLYPSSDSGMIPLYTIELVVPPGATGAKDTVYRLCRYRRIFQPNKKEAY